MGTLQSIKKSFSRPYFFLYALLVFFTPLIFSTNSNELFEFPKMFFVYFVGFLIITFFIVDVIINPIKLKKPHPAVIFLFVTFVVSTLFSTHFYTSIFGYYSRFNGGFLSYFVFFGLYYVALNKLTKEDYKNLLTTSLFTVVPIGFYGLFQYFNGVLRAYSTFGQPNWLAQYLSMILPVLLYVFLSEDSKLSVLWFGIYMFGFYCFWVTYSLSGILGFLVSLAILLPKILRNKKDDKFGYRLTLVILVMVVVPLSNPGIFKDKVGDIIIDLRKNVGLINVSHAQEEESANLSVRNNVSDPGFIRLSLWESSLKMVISSARVFLIGFGPGTFPYNFQPFRSLKLNYSSEWDFVFNKPHNYYIEIWSESGIFSLLSFIFILYLMFKKSPDFIKPSVVAFGVSNIFGWPVVSTSLLFWLLASYALEERFEKKSGSLFSISTRPKFLVIFSSVVLWGVCFFVLFNLSKIYRADINFKKSQEFLSNGDKERALYFANKSIDLNPLEPNYYRGRAKVLTVYLLPTKDISSVKEKMYSDIKKSLELNPLNLVTIRNSIPLYYFLAVEDVGNVSGINNIDTEYVGIVKEFFQNTKYKYWHDAGVVSTIAKYEKRLSFTNEYQESVKRIKEIRPDLLEWHPSFR
jgi:O-antigen ligase